MEMNRIFVALFSVLFVFCTLTISAAQTAGVIPALTGPIVKGTAACNTNYGWKIAKYNGRESCVFCDEKSGWRYAKYESVDTCVRCDEQNGWVYDGKKFCVKKPK
jgi:hypothetical protein